tara:strand:+ start:2655 stop:3557 length:903 start_codon:yes stop_codon:yes gene_type:complete
MSKTVLVTGGSGFVGQRLKLQQPYWTYISSEDCDLTSAEQVADLYATIKPDAVVHLAARVGGIKDNINNQADFYHLNTMMNTNVLHEAHKADIPRVLSSLSTCAYPEDLNNFPFTEDDFFGGPPAQTNFSYGMTKRMLHVASCAYRTQYGLNYSTFCPSNIYGPGDHFGAEGSHFVAALVHKVCSAKHAGTIELWGSGLPLRQQLYVDDLCKIIPLLLQNHNSELPVIVSPPENLSILDLARTLTEQLDKNVRLSFNGKMDGQFRKDGSNQELMKLIGPFKFTSFKEGVMKTYNWYSENK